MEKTCNACRQPKSLDDFGANKRQPDGKQPYCRACKKQRDKEHYETSPHRKSRIVSARRAATDRNRLVVLEHLRAHPCVDCGETDPLFLEFDHVTGVKELEVSAAIHRGWSLQSLLEEMAKCQVRCIKCHRIKTAKEQGWYDLYAGVV